MGFLGFGKKKAEPAIIDFSSYDSMDKVQSAVKKGVLAPMYLVSPMFGGAEDISNTLFVPPGIVQLKDTVDCTLAEALDSGKKVRGFSVAPQYKGKSMIPSSICITAGGDVSIEETIHIW